MEVVEVELKVKQTPEEIEKILLNQGFKILQKVRTIANYYTDKHFSELALDLKEKSIRIRTSIKLNKNSSQKTFSVEHTDNHFNSILKTSSSKFSLSSFKTKRLERKLLKNNINLVLTDDKTDFVYLHPNFETNNIAFQIQTIKGIGTIVAYDNKNYYSLSKGEQISKLINDIKDCGIKIESCNQVQRYESLLSNPIKLSIKEIIKKLKNG